MLGDSLRALLQRFFHTLDHVLGGANPFGPAIGFVLIAAAIGLLGFCLFRLIRSVRRDARSRNVRRSDAPSAAGVRAAELRQAALAAARAGRYRDAAGLLFTAATRELDERGKVGYDAARTPGEYRRVVADPAFDELVRDAVVALFAASEPRDELFARMTQSYDRFFGAAG